MSGGVGCESIKPLIKKFRKYGIPEDRFYCILAGNNAKLKETIAKSCPSDKVQAVGFTDKVHLYLKAADVVISKSGGLSSTEVAVANVPVVHFKPIPGCETCNARFYEAKGMSKLAKNSKEALKIAEALLGDEAEKQSMVEAQRREINAFSADNVVKRVIEVVEARNATEKE